MSYLNRIIHICSATLGALSSKTPAGAHCSAQPLHLRAIFSLIPTSKHYHDTICHSINYMAHRTATVFLLFTLCCIGCRAAGITIQYFTDNACANAAPTVLNTVPNPLVLPINQCVKTFEGNSGIVYSKAMSCTSSGTATANAFTDIACTTPHSTPVSIVAVGVCLNAPLPPNALSLRVTCSTASQVSAAFFSVVAAAVAICM